MDLGAYINIDELDEIAKKNGIDVPRLRGYRLMKDEEPISEEEIREMEKATAIHTVANLCEADPFWSSDPAWYTSSRWTRYLKDYYLVKDSEGDYVDIRWDRIHGKKRKILKFEIKKAIRKIRKQWAMWNKYAGQDGVLYIHSRIGGNNWMYFKGPELVEKQPWFLDRVDDHFDSTYCDIYAKIDVEKDKENEC